MEEGWFEEDIREAFNVFDQNGDDFITRQRAQIRAGAAGPQAGPGRRGLQEDDHTGRRGRRRDGRFFGVQADDERINKFF
ncbi:calmodulin-like protein 3 [Phtheirospermum japonicum]|uniref:Calmodulin-like protein 3 n=1 Tax=Phtheirospermum japonicum TaxID=374723 RepID=A0A830BCG2_9LAMI|nr:calmodulin-like protein 3 [Phtheirospermum japonicum]